MKRKVVMTIMALLAGGCLALTSPPASAEPGQQQQHQRAQGQPRGAMSPRGGARQVGPRSPRAVTSRSAHEATARGSRTTTPRSAYKVTPHRSRVATPRAPHKVAPRGDIAHIAIAGKLRGMPARGAGRTSIRGHNYSVWRGGHRVRHGRGWGTFVSIGALGAIAIGSSEYYPYAYISASKRYCGGLTDDGCQLRWQEVETVEGDEIDQCVAYCPWQ
jgi:hypothetical protein